MEALDFTMHNPVSTVPPWIFPEVKTDFSIMEKKKEWRMEEVGVKTSMYLRNSYSSYLNIYTDGSKNKQESVGIGIHIPEFKIDISKRITDQYIWQNLWQSSLHYSGLKNSNLIGLQYAQSHEKYTVNDICQRRLNDRSLSQFVMNS